MDYMIKSWRPIIESFSVAKVIKSIGRLILGKLYKYLSSQQLWNINRGDTNSDACKTNGLPCRLDLRVIVHGESKKKKYDMTTAAFAKEATRAKLYKDKVKSTLATQCHMHDFTNQTS
jgi:hypothetical protein